MKLPAIRTSVVLGLLIPCAAVSTALLACSGGSSTDVGSGSNNTAAPAASTPAASNNTTTSTDGTDPTSCATNDLQVLFSSMYTSFDGTHTFQVPAVVNGISSSAVKWSVSDGTTAKIEPDDSSGGIMITALKAGSVDIIATAGTLCGKSTLTIASATADDWTAGSARYNDGVVLNFGPGHQAEDGGAGLASCTNCHGPTANGAFKDVAHTPEQTGGFSDDDLNNIFRNGTVPDGGYFDPSIVPYDRWQQFHKWSMTDDEAKGIVVYLRSLTPTPQDGASNFGGHFDGGWGGHHMDGGGE